MFNSAFPHLQMTKLRDRKIEVTQVENGGSKCKILLDFGEGRTSSARGWKKPTFHLGLQKMMKNFERGRGRFSSTSTRGSKGSESTGGDLETASRRAAACGLQEMSSSFIIMHIWGQWNHRLSHWQEIPRSCKHFRYTNKESEAQRVPVISLMFLGREYHHSSLYWVQ